MSEVVIRVKGLGKRYRIGKLQKYKTFRDVLADAIRSPVREALAVARGGRSEWRARRNDEYLWALKDVSFEVKQGEVVGIIGRNGAGKSTLLKILSRITEPTVGRARIRGRVGSLLEVGTGFHPELTGRENIYLNGAILGMRRAEIKRNFDEIVAFSGIEKFIDTPVKHYSSGMYVRLAFAVAIHLETEILIVDEVLAVGDAAFQKKSLAKMGGVAKTGRTVLFVSHNMAAINMLCSRSILLDDGCIGADGDVAQIVYQYLTSVKDSSSQVIWPNPETAPGNHKVRLRAVRIVSAGQVKNEVDIDKEVSVEVEFWNLMPDSHLFTNIFLLDGMGGIVLESANTPGANRLPEHWFGRPHPAGLFRTSCTFPSNFLNEGVYHITVQVASFHPPIAEVKVSEVLTFSVLDTGSMRTPGFGGKWNGVVRVPLDWYTEFLDQPLEVSLTPD